MAETLTIPDNRNTNPQTCDSNTVDTEACTNPKHKALLQSRTNPDPIVKHMVDMFQLWEVNHVGYQRMTSVNQPSAAPEKPSTGQNQTLIPSHEDADYSGGEIRSYNVDSSQKEVKELHTFTKEAKIQFEEAYLKMTNSLTEVYSGLSILEARVVVQACCFCKKLPTGDRAASQSLRLAFDTLEAKSKWCKNNSPTDPDTTVRKANCEPDPAYMDPDEYDQYELFQEL